MSYVYSISSRAGSAAVADRDHVPVLRDAALAGLAPRADGIYVDATFGRGGHTGALLDAIGPEGRVIAFDQDPDAAATAATVDDARLTFVAGSFAHLAAELEQRGLAGRINGLLFDLGVSSPQFDVAERGFSLRLAGPLDMRMNPSAGQPVSAWLAEASHGEIARVIKTLGEEPMAGRIASAILKARDAGRLADTRALAEVVRGAVPARVAEGKRIHPATRTFQAFRMHINDELGALDAALAGAMRVLAPGGRLAVISFHSLEDRRVKRFMRHQARPPLPAVPMAEPTPPALTLIGKPVKADATERADNPRARSAIMRVAKRTRAPEVVS